MFPGTGVQILNNNNNLYLGGGSNSLIPGSGNGGGGGSSGGSNSLISNNLGVVAGGGGGGIIESVQIERKFVLDSIIVKIMKSRKKLEHAELVNEVLKITQIHHFVPEISLIKMCIESLVEREYL